jgi:primosomal protein N' (replication factor Y)
MPRFVRVLLDQSTGKALDYRIPTGMEGGVAVGSRVRVPLRTRLVPATVVAVLDESDAPGVREIAEVLGETPLIRPVLLQLARWMADYYCCPEEVALRSVLPEVIRRAEVGPKIRAFVQLRAGVTEEEISAVARRAPKQAEALRAMAAAGGEVEVAQYDRLRSAFLALERRGLAVIAARAVARDPEGVFLESGALGLNEEQSRAFEAVTAAIDHPDTARPVLLFGVTGSGKTEVYLQAIRHALDRGRTALVLVPEISLTPQTVERFKSRFAEIQREVAVMHSHLSEGERRDEWHKIHSGAARIVIGARSAVFAPLDRLGLIVVDEEHETSYKQEEAPRYQARDVAVVRASMEPCAVLLGSATPSMETYHNTETGKYRLVRLNQRIDDRRMPLIRVVDMRQSNRKRGADPIISPLLAVAVQRRLDRGEQCILFLNRRGYAPSVICTACGHVCHCPNCSVALTFHRADDRILCHICGHTERAPRSCPSCQDPNIRHAGIGTQRVEEAVKRSFPKARIARMDADAMSRKGAYRETLGQFKAGEIDILIGTQMIAKGLHFPNVTLVGIVNADVGLHVADFRAGERTFQLLTQVAGRAGRGETEGEVLVQTFTPFSPSIQHARHHDFEGYWEQESQFRERFGYPPFTRAVLLTIRSRVAEKAEFCAQTVCRRLREALPDGITLGDAVAAPLAKAKAYFRFHVMLRGPSALKMSRLVRSVLERLPLPPDVLISVDVDAHQLL